MTWLAASILLSHNSLHERTPPHGIKGRTRRVARLGYGLFRPVLRPLAWRMRRFLTAEIAAELTDARTRQETALHRLDAMAHRPDGSGAAADPRLAEAMERLLLTLALEDLSRTHPPGLSNPPHAG